MSARRRALWDFAGFDGLALARALFGPAASDLSAYQSLETEWHGAGCALLRLCENNFRVGLSGGPQMGGLETGGAALEAALQAEAEGRRVWVKPSGLMSLLLDDAQAWDRLRQVGTAKPPHRLAGLPLGHAVPARLGDCAALVWRHPVGGVPTVEVQTAPGNLEAMQKLFLSQTGQ